LIKGGIAQCDTFQKASWSNTSISQIDNFQIVKAFEPLLLKNQFFSPLTELIWSKTDSLLQNLV
jgi:hypothetical protein